MKNILPFMFLILISVVSINTFASTKVVLSAPGHKEIIVQPKGGAKCHVVHKGYHNGVWQDSHKVCRYSHGRGIWVAGHWQCTKLSHRNNRCIRWDFIQSHWQNKKVAVYGNPKPHVQVVNTKPTVYVTGAPKPVRPPKPSVAITISS